jgi:hypothetical protein
MRYAWLLVLLTASCRTAAVACEVGEDDLVVCRDKWYSPCGVHLRDCVDDYAYDCMQDVRCLEMAPNQPAGEELDDER